MTPDGAHISVDSRRGRSRRSACGASRSTGAAGDRCSTRVKPVGYHAWADDHTLALFVLGQPATLQLADTRTGDAEILAARHRPIPPADSRRGGTISVVERGCGRRLWIRELDPKTRRITPLVAAVAGAKEADCAWTPDGMLLMAEKDVLYGWRRGETAWRRLADLAALGLHGVTRIAVSPKGDQIAFVTQAASYVSRCERTIVVASVVSRESIVSTTPVERLRDLS